MWFTKEMQVFKIKSVEKLMIGIIGRVQGKSGSSEEKAALEGGKLRNMLKT